MQFTLAAHDAEAVAKIWGAAIEEVEIILRE